MNENLKCYEIKNGFVTFRREFSGPNETFFHLESIKVISRDKHIIFIDGKPAGYLGGGYQDYHVLKVMESLMIDVNNAKMGGRK